MDDETRDFVRTRADCRCEYCRIPERYFNQLFQIEHIVAKSHGGSDERGNLALACRQCNLHKGPNLSGIDPNTGELTRLFNPRKDTWEQHFEERVGVLEGRTAVGRTSARVLNMNTDVRIEMRLELRKLRRIPNQ